MRPADLAEQRRAVAVPEWLERENTTKLCSRCDETKPLEAFGPNARNAGRVGKGRATYCRECEAARLRAKRSTRTYAPARPLIVPADPYQRDRNR